MLLPSKENGHGRHEIRSCFTIDNLKEIPMSSDWSGLRTVGVVISDVTQKDKTTTSCRYYISSIENKAELLAESVRSHWGIENSALLRHIALNLLKKEKTVKLGIKNKRLQAGWDNDYLRKIVAGL